MEEKVSGIVLKSVSFGESDKILTLFTLEKGIVSAKIKGVKKAGAKLKFATEPFCFAEYIFSTSADRRTVIGASLIDSFYPIRENIIKYYSAGTIIEFVKKLAKEEIVSPDMFFLMVENLKKIAYTKINSKVYTIRFLCQALKIVGYGLKIDSCCKCNNNVLNRCFFDYLSGCFYCENCFFGEGIEISVLTFETLSNIDLRDDFDNTLLTKCLKLMDFYIKNKVEENISSLAELILLQ